MFHCTFNIFLRSKNYFTMKEDKNIKLTQMVLICGFLENEEGTVYTLVEKIIIRKNMAFCNKILSLLDMPALAL